MNRFGRLFVWVLAGALGCILLAVPVHAAETKTGETAKDSTSPTRESDVVRASREIQAKKTGTAKTYGNEDLKSEQPTAKVYTNDDLLRKYGAAEEPEATTAKPEDSPTTDTPQSELDPLEWMEQEQKSRAAQKDSVAEAESALTAAQERLKELEVQLLAAKNPFSARPSLSEEEQTTRATSGETAEQRYARTQKMVEEAKQAVADAEANLSQARSQ